MLAAKLGKCETSVGARKCTIKELDYNEAKDFLTTNHLQGNVPSSTRIGLYFEDELIALGTFGKKRKALNQKAKAGELYRFASKLNTNVHGGFSKILSYFITTYQPKEILTYASLDHSTGGLYTKTGFDLSSITNPGYSCVVDSIRKHRYNYTKQKLVSSGADPNLTEREIMHSRGHYRIWDSGNLKFLMILV